MARELEEGEVGTTRDPEGGDTHRGRKRAKRTVCRTQERGGYGRKGYRTDEDV